MDQEFDPVKLKAAAEAGDMESQSDYANFLLADRQYADAVEWFRRAADAKHPMSIFSLAQFYREGLGGCSKDPETASTLLKEAQSLGCHSATLLLAEDALEAGEWKGAHDLLRSVLDSGTTEQGVVTETLMLLATVHHEAPADSGVFDVSAAATCIRRAADIGDPAACHNAGLMLFEGRGADANPWLAVRYLARACSLGHTTSLPTLAFALFALDARPDGERVHSQFTQRARAILASPIAVAADAEGVQKATIALQAASIDDQATAKAEPTTARVGCASLACVKASLLDTDVDALSAHAADESAPVSLKQCSRCRTVSYCSRECQQDDWKLFGHAALCKAAAAAASATSRP